MLDDSTTSSNAKTPRRLTARTDRMQPHAGMAKPVQRYERRSASIATLLQRQLQAAASFHDLSRQKLQASSRNVLELTAGGAVPTPLEFWEQTAQPQARNLFDAVTAAIDAEVNELTKALQQFATGIRIELRAGGGRLEPGVDIDDLCTVAEHGVRRVAVAVRGLDEIDDLGRWWQSRLRRAAIRSVVGKVLTSPLREFELIVAAAEMQLLEQPPWSHDDRLLSAFELVHSDIREYAMVLETRMQRQARGMVEAVGREDLIDGARRSRPSDAASSLSPADGFDSTSTLVDGPESAFRVPKDHASTAGASSVDAEHGSEPEPPGEPHQTIELR